MNHNAPSTTETDADATIAYAASISSTFEKSSRSKLYSTSHQSIATKSQLESGKFVARATRVNAGIDKLSTTPGIRPSSPRPRHEPAEQVGGDGPLATPGSVLR